MVGTRWKQLQLLKRLNNMDSAFERFVLWHAVFVGMQDVRRYMTDSPSYQDAVNTHLITKENLWLEENPRPLEARFIQDWFMRKLAALYPDYQFLVDGHEVSTAEALKMNIFTWNIKLRLTYDAELGNALELEKGKNDEGR